MFHVKHRAMARLAVLALGLVALLAAGCAGRVGPPQGWTAAIRSGDLTILQVRRGELAAIRLDVEDDPLTKDVDERVAWRFPGDADNVDLKAVYADPILDGQTLYIAAYSGDVLALDISGEAPRARWLSPLGDHIIATPAFDGSTLYVATQGGDVIPIDAETGNAGDPIAHAGDRIWSMPLIEGGTIYVPALDSKIRAVNLADGVERWSRSLSGAVPGDPGYGDDLIVVGSFDRALYAVDPATGDEDWRFHGDGWFWAKPLVAGNVVYAASTRGSVYALNAGGGDGSRELWRFNELDSEIRSAPVLAGGVLVVAAEEGTIFGIDPATGEARWTELLPGQRFLANPLVLDSTLVYATMHGDLIQIDPQSGSSTLLYKRS